MEFQIPLSREDLLRPTGGSEFFVSEPLPAREIVSRLEGRPSNACPPPCPSLPPSFFLLYTLTSLILCFPSCYVSVVDCLIMHASSTPRYSNILSRMQVTAGLPSFNTVWVPVEIQVSQLVRVKCHSSRY